MEIILKENVANVGDINTIVNVKNGFARNFLIPQGKAVVANESNRKILANTLKFASRKQDALLADYKEIAKKLDAATVTVGAKTGTTDKIFGSVTTHHLAEAIKAQLGVEVDRRAIVIAEGEEIKTTGDYKAEIKLHEEVQCSLDFKVVSE